MVKLNTNLSSLYATTNLLILLKAPITVYVCAAPANNKRSEEETDDWSEEPSTRISNNPNFGE